MSKVAWGIAGILGLGLVVTTVQNRKLTAQVDALTTQLAEKPQREGRRVATLSAGSGDSYRPERDERLDRPSHPDGLKPEVETLGDSEEIEEAVEEAVEERLKSAIAAHQAEQFEERRSRMLDNMTTAVDDFADKVEMTDEERDALHDVMEASLDEMNEVWSTYQSDDEREFGREEMHEEMAEVRMGMRKDLVELLGPEDAAAFQKELRGPLAWRY